MDPQKPTVDPLPARQVAQPDTKRNGELTQGTSSEPEHAVTPAEASNSRDTMQVPQPAHHGENDEGSNLMDNEEPMFEVPRLPKRNGNKTPREAEIAKNPDETESSP